MKGSPPGSYAHGIFQARILEWGPISSSKGSFWPRDQIQASCIFYIVRQSLTLAQMQIQRWINWGMEGLNNFLKVTFANEKEEI